MPHNTEANPTFSLIGKLSVDQGPKKEQLFFALYQCTSFGESQASRSAQGLQNLRILVDSLGILVQFKSFHFTLSTTLGFNFFQFVEHGAQTCIE
mmetsp:Transcript_37725/g.55401  ORF Transcript_37725/g.55401 Transcript_37725/m.55401 type:complete len:95 (+) Transcript_37725:398-682(+)